MATIHEMLPKPGSARREGGLRKKSFSTSVALALPKIVEQGGGGVDEDNSKVSANKGSKAECSSASIRNSRERAQTIGPMIKKINLDSNQQEDNKDSKNIQKQSFHKVTYPSRQGTRLGQDRFRTHGRRPSTSAWPQPECKLSLNISNIPIRHSKNISRQIPSAKSYQNERLPSLDNADQSVEPGKSSVCEIADLCIGIQETWKVTSSEQQKTRPKQITQGSHDSVTRAKRKRLPINTRHLIPLHSSLGVVGFGAGNNSSRTSSRMGRNSLDQFLRNVSTDSDLASVKPKLVSDKIVDRKEEAKISLSPLSSHENQLLQLKGFVRDPSSYHRIGGLTDFTEKRTRSSSKVNSTLTSSRPSGKRTRMTPYNLQQAQCSDVPIPVSSNPLDEAYHVFKYIAL